MLTMFSMFLSSCTIGDHAQQEPTKDDVPVQFYIAPNGSDKNDGSIKKPFATLEKARDTIRELKSNGGIPAGGIAVNLRKGDYRITSSFVLNGQDSGSPGSPILYRAYPNEKVTLVGGEKLTASQFKKVSDAKIVDRIPKEARDKVVQLDLKALGITQYGAISSNQVGTGGNNTAVPLELFINDKAMKLARWPNDGFAKVNKVMDKGSSSKGLTFTFTGNGLRKWDKMDDVWVLGYWGNDWATNDLQIKSIDFDKKQIVTLKTSSYEAKDNQRFYIYNVLEELDSPGEWYLDRSSGMLYLYPPSSLKESTIQISLLESNMIMLSGASNIVIDGVGMEVSRGNAIDIKGDNNLIRNCSVSKMGGYAVKVEGKNNGVVGSHIYSMGNGGVYLNGGDSTTLTPAGNYVENSHIHDFARIKLTYTPAVELNGVGNRASHNELHDSPHFAIRFSGNEHVMEYNNIYDCVKETGDASAIYAGRSFVWRGNIIRYNYIHDIVNNGSSVSTAAIYLDDFMSGVEIRGNVFYKIGRQALKLANGRENIVENNIMMESSQSVAFLKRDYSSPTNSGRVSLFNRFNSVPYRNEIWSKRYPTLPAMPGDDWEEPIGNIVRNNVLYKSGAISGDDRNMKLGNFENNITFGPADDLGFVDAANKNFELKEDSIIFSKIPEFKKIPFSQIGIVKEKK